eukprot:234843-Lingulodinium_polyedra.AAC.1
MREGGANAKKRQRQHLPGLPELQDRDVRQRHDRHAAASGGVGVPKVARDQGREGDLSVWRGGAAV